MSRVGYARLFARRLPPAQRAARRPTNCGVRAIQYSSRPGDADRAARRPTNCGGWNPPYICRLTGRVTFSLACLLALSGCGANRLYDRIQLGQSPREYKSVLPEATSRRTVLGLCHFHANSLGRTDALVVLLSDDRRVAAKLLASYVAPTVLNARRGGYRLRGELDPKLYDVSGTGPIDAFRLIAAELANYRGEKLARDAHAWVAAGIIRLLQRWPKLRDSGVRSDRLDLALERVRGGGGGAITVDEAGVYRISYRADR